MSRTSGMLLPGATLGIFGGGQLGRMFVQTAQRMGYRVHVYTPEVDSPAGQVADQSTIGPLEDLERVEQFARSVDAVTLEFENVPTETLRTAEALVPVRPGAKVLSTTQHRLREKEFLESVGVPVGPFASVTSLETLERAATRLGLPAVLKTCELGYDGKGQQLLREETDVARAWETLGPQDCLYESFIPFVRELSVLVARDSDGTTVHYGPIENHHAHHVLDYSLLPAPATHAEVPQRAAEVATTIADALDVVGVLCVELFECAEGELLVNEVAPRPHNSGHLTIEACRTSQFEQQVRALCGLPLGSSESLRPAAMANLLGDLWTERNGPNWPAALAKGTSLHLYGKSHAASGRKMGHLTVLSDSIDEAKKLVLASRASLS